MTARAAFKKADVERAVKGILAAGLPVVAVEFTRDGFAVIIGEPEQGKRPNPLDKFYGIAR